MHRVKVGLTATWLLWCNLSTPYASPQKCYVSIKVWVVMEIPELGLPSWATFIFSFKFLMLVVIVESEDNL